MKIQAQQGLFKIYWVIKLKDKKLLNNLSTERDELMRVFSTSW